MASLLSWLGGVAKGVERQLNPFDGGATYANPHPQSPPVRPAAPVVNAINQATGFDANIVNRPLPTLSGGGNPLQGTLQALSQSPVGRYTPLGIPLAIANNAAQFGFDPNRQAHPASLQQLGNFVHGITSTGVANSPLGAAGNIFGSIAEQLPGNPTANQPKNVPLFGTQQSFSGQVHDNGVVPTVIQNAFNLLGAASAAAPAEKVTAKLPKPAEAVHTAAANTKMILADQRGSVNNIPGKERTTSAYINELTKAQKNAEGKSGKLQLAKKEFAAKGLDALSPIEKPVEAAAGGRGATLSLRNQLDRSLRSGTIAGQYAKDNGLHEIVNGVKDTKAFDQYVIAKHAVDLEANGIKTGRNLGRDAKLVQDLAPKYEAQAKALTRYNNKLLDKTVDYGLISKETADYLKQKYPNYVPFDRIFTDAEMAGQRGNGAGPASLSTQTVVQRIKGSERQIQSPLESVLAKTHDVIAQGERNLAAREIANTAQLPGNPLGLREIPATETIGNRSTISYIDNGVKRTFQTTPEVAQAAKSLNQTQLGLVGKILSYPTRVLRLGATGVNLPFAAANVVKDTASSFINSEHPVQASIANPKVFLNALSASFHHKSAAYGELVREGAGGTSFDIARNAAKDTIGKIRSERSVATKAAYTVRHPGELLRAVEDTIGRSEEFGRAMQYYGNKEAALKAGKTIGEAQAYGADAARNNTVNFARAGEYGRVLNSTLPYFNAGIQGSRTLLRNLRDRPVQTSAKIAISASLPVATTTAWNISDPKRKAAYDDIQDYEKEGNIIIVPPNPKKDPNTGKWNVIKIPVSQEIANLNNVIRNGVEAMQKDKGINFPAMAGNLFGTATSLNTQSPRQLANQVIPQGIKPAIEGLTNQNLFTGNQIVSDKLKNLDAKDQVGQYTSGTAKVLGGAINISPLQIDNFIKTTLGGAGQTAVNVGDAGLAKLGVIKPDEVRGKSLQGGVTGRFYGAQGQSEYAPIDKAIKTNADKLKATDGYKQLSSDDKAKALNNLQNDVITATKQQVDAKNNTGQYAPDFTGKSNKLSARQVELLDGTADLTKYLPTQKGKSSNGIISLSTGEFAATIDGTDKTFKTQQQAQKAIDYQNFKDSDKINQLSSDGSTVFRKDAQGNPSQMSKVQYDYQVGTATLTSQKNAGDYQGYIKTARSQLQSIAKQLQDPSIDPLDSLILQDKAAALQKSIDKYSSYGGFTKPKAGPKPPKPSAARFKVASSRALKAPKVPSFKVARAKAFKAPTTRKLSVSKIPSNYVNRKLG